MSFFADWTTFALAGVVLAVSAVPAWLGLGWATGLLLAWTGWVIPPAVSAAFLAACSAILLARPNWRSVGGLAAGFAVTQSSVLLVSQGAPPSLAWTLGTSLLIVSFVYSRRSPYFAPPVIQDEARLIVLALGLGAAATPEIMAGWESARALNSAADAVAQENFPVWVMAAVALTALAGVVSRGWRRN